MARPCLDYMIILWPNLPKRGFGRLEAQTRLAITVHYNCEVHFVPVMVVKYIMLFEDVKNLK